MTAEEARVTLQQAFQLTASQSEKQSSKALLGSGPRYPIPLRDYSHQNICLKARPRLQL